MSTWLPLRLSAYTHLSILSPCLSPEKRSGKKKVVRRDWFNILLLLHDCLFFVAEKHLDPTGFKTL
jgi:hypothetical protein